MSTESSESSEHPNKKDSIFRASEAVGDAWSWLVMREAVFYGIDRFADFQTRLGISRSTLSARLAQLTDAGLLTPSYRLTESGQDFFGCLMVALRWGDRWHFSPETRPLDALHNDCEHPVDAVLRCAECRQIVQPYDVIARRGGFMADPGADRFRRRTPDLELLERERTCSIARTLTVTGEWWSSLVIRESFFGTRRFDDFQRRLDIAPNILSQRLRRLVELDVLAKVQYETWPIRHEYRLTERGTDLYHLPLAMLTWGQRWLKPVESDTRLTHKTCGNELRPVLTCGPCGETITRHDVTLT